MRVLLVLCAVAACGAPSRPLGPGETGPIRAPGLRLPDTVTPLSYDLALELDPDRESFRGEVTIHVRLERASDHVWLHADQLAIETSTWAGGALTPLAIQGEQMRAFGFGRVVPAGPTTLHFTFVGRTTGDQEGLFRQRAGDWYLFTQGESVFTRRITPCFDEPRWKTPWRVSVVAPRRDVVLANAPEQATTVLRGGKKRVVFAETAPLPSYLLALAVGPFDLVDAGRVGRNKIPVRVAVRAGQGRHVGVVAARLPAVVTALESYLDDALPLTKLDLVGVPSFFGAMENPGLITFQEAMLVGNAHRGSFADYFAYIAAHELAHQWFGNLVTPAWWDHLWLSEAFASWLGDKVIRGLGAYDDAPLRFALARREAIAADGETGAQPLQRHVTTNLDADEGFDAIAYAKGQLVLATFEAFVGRDEFRDRVRAYIKAERGRVVTTGELVGHLGIPALEEYAATTGTPVVDLSLRCTGKPVVVAHARSGHVPVCIAAGTQRSCALVGTSTEIPVGDACPATVHGNIDGGYYHVWWKTNGPRGPAPRLETLDPALRIIAGDDLAAAIDRGELSATDALAQLRELADSHDAYAQLGALALARAIDDLVDDAARSAWTAFLAARFADRLDAGKRLTAAEGELVVGLIELVPADRFTSAAIRRAADVVDRRLAIGDEPLPAGSAGLAAVHDADKLFDRIVDRAVVVRDEDVRDALIESLGELPAAQAGKLVAYVTRGELPFSTTWVAVTHYFERPATRAAAWQAVRGALDDIRQRAATADDHHAIMVAVSHLCDVKSRGEVAAAFAGDKDVTTTLRAIDRCIERRAKLGDVASALAQPAASAPVL